LHRVGTQGGEHVDERLDVSSVEKLCFASDCSYFIEEHFAFEKYIAFYQRFFDKVKLSEGLREKINSGNGLNLFK
jgi:hypothetical protein